MNWNQYGLSLQQLITASAQHIVDSSRAVDAEVLLVHPLRAAGVPDEQVTEQNISTGPGSMAQACQWNLCPSALE